MSSDNSSGCSRLSRAATISRNVSTIGFLIVLLAIHHNAQTSTISDGSTPEGAAPGAPVGSAALSGLENINRFNGHLNFHVPMLEVGGRGSAQMAMMLAIDNQWHVKTEAHTPSVGPLYYQYVPELNPWSPLKPGYGPGVLLGRRAGEVNSSVGCGDQNNPWSPYSTSLTRLTFTLPDGSEYELRDQLPGVNGRPLAQSHPYDCYPFGTYPPATSRGRVFASADGSAATFVSDADIYDAPDTRGAYPFASVFAPTGYLMLRDGSRSRIEGGLIKWTRDRNGNQLTFTYGTSASDSSTYNKILQITDSLDRQINVAYDVADVAPYGLCDKITFKGSGGADRILRVSKTNLHDALRSGYSIQTDTQLFNGSDGGFTVDPIVMSSVWLPNGQRYRFLYDSYVELARVELPEGGAVEYDYGGYGDPTNDGFFYTPPDQGNSIIYRRLIERRVSSNGASWDGKTKYYAYETAGYPMAMSRITVYDLDPNDSMIAVQVHYFNGGALASMVGKKAIEYSAWKDGHEYQTELFGAENLGYGESPQTPLRRVNRTWQQRAPVDWWRTDHPNLPLDLEPPNDPRLVEVSTTLTDENLVTKQAFNYDQYNNQTDVYDYDFEEGEITNLPRRRTHTDYATAGSYTDPVTGAHLRSLPLQTSVYDAGGVERGRISFEYDNYVTDANHAALVNRADMSGFDSSFSTSYFTRGNVTATTHYLLTNGSVTGSITGYAQYDIAGNVVQTIDARGCATAFDFSDRFGTPDGDARQNGGATELNSAGQHSYAFSTLATNCLGHTAYIQFDYYTSQAVDGEDANGVVASSLHNDVLDRPTQVIRAVNQSVLMKSQTLVNYDDANNMITTMSDLSALDDNGLKVQTLHDGLGRVIESRAYEDGSNYVAIKTQYDALGRAYKVSNPFRPWKNETPVWTTTAFDALGRVISVTTPDGAIVSKTYDGNVSVVTDQSGRQRMSSTNALGQLTNVWEFTAPNLANEVASYGYDALDDLVTVNKDGQTRTFAYDSLKRLTSATNPENGTISYQYDNNGNLLVRTDARGASAHYEYDSLNRVTRRWYNGSSSSTSTINNSPALPAGVSASAEVKYFYDAQGLPDGAPTFDRGSSIGRLVGVTYGGGSAGDYYGFDPLGRPSLKIQRTEGVNYQTNVLSYNLAGSITSESYPSGHTVNYNYDSTGRLADKDTANLAFTGNLGDGTTRTYSTGITYASAGQMTQEQFGTTTPIYQKLAYNARGQLSEMRASTMGGDDSWNRGKIINWHSLQCGGASCNATDNNGNLRKQEVYVPNNEPNTNWTSWYQQYEYDLMNRLTQVHEYTGNTQFDWQQSYSYDHWGNRTIDIANTSANIPHPAFNVDTNTNRLTVPAGQSGTMAYDTAGNLTTDTYSGAAVARAYDAENRMTSETQANNLVAGSYAYNGDGRRVKRNVNGTETWQVYGLGGELLAEYGANGTPTSPQKEYGYRNGQLLVVAEAGVPPCNRFDACGAPPDNGGNENGGNSSAPAYNVVISQVYGGGGNSGATYKNDFIEIFNRGTTTVDLTNWSVQYAADTSGIWHVTPLSGSLPPGHYYLVQESQGVGGTVNLPTPDSTDTVDLNAVAGKVALVNGSTPVNQGGVIIDLVGYGSTANQFEGSGPTSSPSNTSAVLRGGNGCIDLNDNKSDFDTGSPTPRNNSSATNTCSSPTGSATIVISEFRTRGPNGGNDEFIELYNLTNSSIDISGWKIKASNSSAAIGTRVTISANTSVPAHKHFLVTNVNTSLGYSGAVPGDQTYTLGVSDDGGIAVTKPDDTIVDQVGLSSGSAFREGRVLQQLTTNVNRGYERKPGGTSGSGQDTNDNKSDFAIRTPCDPQNLQSPPQQPPPNNPPTVNITNPGNNATFPSGSSVEIDANASDSDGTISKVEFFVGTTLLWQDTSAPYSFSWGNIPAGTYALTARATDNLGAATVSSVVNFTVTNAPQVNIHWVVTDQLGTPRMVFDQSGSLANMSRHDYLPFGEDLYAGIGGRTTQQGYTANDNVRQKFTLYERDNETGLDFAEARYYSSSEGRYTRPDPYNVIFEMKAGRNARERTQILLAYISEPQNWNRYSYCINNPTDLYDPSGLIWLTKDHEDYQWVDDDKYKEEDWKGYEKANGAIAYFGEGWGSYADKYSKLKGSYVTLNADGTLSFAGVSAGDDYPDTIDVPVDLFQNTVFQAFLGDGPGLGASYVPSTGQTYLTPSVGNPGKAFYLGVGETTNLDQSGPGFQATYIDPVGGGLTVYPSGDTTSLFGVGFAKGGSYGHSIPVFRAPRAIFNVRMHTIDPKYGLPLGDGLYAVDWEAMAGGP